MGMPDSLGGPSVWSKGVECALCEGERIKIIMMTLYPLYCH